MKLLLKNNKKFSYTNKLPIKAKIGIFIVGFICVGFSLFSYFIEVGPGYSKLIDYSNFDPIDLDVLVLKPVGLMMAGIAIPAISCCLQITTRNKLAEPTTLGLYPTIMLGIIVSKLTISRFWMEFLLSVIFCSTIVFVNMILSRNGIFKSNFKIVLIGFCLSGMLTGVNWIITRYKPVQGINPLDWLLGTPCVDINQNTTILCSCIIIICTIIIFILIPYFNIIQKDITLAKTLGINVELIFWTVAFLSVFIVVSSIMIAGGVTLLGLVTPHIFRLIFKTDDNRVIIPLSSLFGMFILLSSNLLRNYSNLNINLLPALLAIPILVFLLKGKKS